MRTTIIPFDLIEHRPADRGQKYDTTVKQVPYWGFFGAGIELYNTAARRAAQAGLAIACAPLPLRDMCQVWKFPQWLLMRTNSPLLMMSSCQGF
jgi:hypothetical protein